MFCDLQHPRLSRGKTNTRRDVAYRFVVANNAVVSFLSSKLITAPVVQQWTLDLIKQNYDGRDSYEITLKSVQLKSGGYELIV